MGGPSKRRRLQHLRTRSRAAAGARTGQSRCPRRGPPALRPARPENCPGPRGQNLRELPTGHHRPPLAQADDRLGDRAADGTPPTPREIGPARTVEPRLRDLQHSPSTFAETLRDHPITAARSSVRCPSSVCSSLSAITRVRRLPRQQPRRTPSSAKASRRSARRPPGEARAHRGSSRTSSRSSRAERVGEELVGQDEDRPLESSARKNTLRAV